MRRAWLVATLVAAPLAARADRVAVKVVEVAGDVAYVTPGRTAGLAPGTKIAFAGGERVVLEVTDATASIKLDGLALAIGAAGTADVATGAGISATGDKPLRAAQVVAEWPDPVPPAETQAPKAVPLGNTRKGGAAHVTVIGSGYGALARGGNSFADGQARIIASWDMMTDRPLAGDLDIAGRYYSEGFDEHLRVPLFASVAQLRYGSAMDPMFAIGRLRFAAASVGMLDGARGSVHAGALEVAAFGGLVPDPISGKPDTGASRFGAEAIYDLHASPWAPRIAVTATGSTWSGQVDERRLSVDASASRGGLALDGWAEAQQFPASNPWHAHAVELTGAGASASYRSHDNHLGVDLDFMRPDRSLRLAAALPAAWLCTQVAQPGDVAEGCRGGDSWMTATASAGTRRGRFTLDAYGTVGRTHLIETSIDTSAYVRGEVQLGEHRVMLGGTVGKASFGSWDSGEVGAGTTMWHPVDLLVRYRAEILDYVASTGPVLMHSVTADLRVPWSNSIDLALSAVGTTGPDRSLVALLTTLVWRPLP